MTEQLALFTITPAPTIKTVVDPYWDEIVREQESTTTKAAPEHTLAVGDWVKLSPDWMNKCAATVTGNYKKDYQFKTDADLICKVIWVDPQGNGHIYVERGKDNAVFVPQGNFIREQVTPDTSNTQKSPDVSESDEERWNPEYFGETPFKTDGDQLTIFYDDSDEPPEPDDFDNLQDYQQAWDDWEKTHGEYKKYPVNRVSESYFGGDDSLTENHVRDNDDSLTPVNTYKPAGTARGDLKYFRYSFRDGNRIKHLHIPGGNTSRPKAQSNASAVRRAIVAGKPPQHIKQMIRGMR